MGGYDLVVVVVCQNVPISKTAKNSVALQQTLSTETALAVFFGFLLLSELCDSSHLPNTPNAVHSVFVLLFSIVVIVGTVVPEAAKHRVCLPRLDFESSFQPFLFLYSWTC